MFNDCNDFDYMIICFMCKSVLLLAVPYFVFNFNPRKSKINFNNKQAKTFFI